MSASTIPSAKAALLGLMQGALTDVRVTWGGPTSEEDTALEMAHLGNVEQTEEWGALGNQRRDEDYDIEVFILVRQSGDDEQATETRAWAIRELLATALRADPTLGGVLSKWAEITATTQDNTPLMDGWFTRLRVTVHCEARI